MSSEDATIACSKVVVAASCHRKSLGSIPQRSQISQIHITGVWALILWSPEKNINGGRFNYKHCLRNIDAIIYYCICHWCSYYTFKKNLFFKNNIYHLKQNKQYSNIS